jgi:LacI family transcriptional regulator
MAAVSAKNEKTVTIREVAEAAGVSVGTVSRALNAPTTVRPVTLEKVRAVIDAMGFQPDPRAQTMRRRTTMTVGFIVNDITNPLHATVFKAAETELREPGFTLHLVNTGGEPRREAAAIDFLQRGRVDGLIMTINSEQDPECRARLGALRVPGVLLDRELPVNIDAVMTDHATGMRQAVDYLIGLGHRRIALITAGTEIFPGRERKRGFVEAFARRGLPCPADLIRAQHLSAAYGQKETATLLRAADPPTAIIAGGNQILVGALRAIQQQGLTIGRDLSLITCDRTDLATTYPGPLTLIDRDVEAIGRTAAELLLERMTARSTEPPRRVTFPTTLILGHSCGPPPPAR